MFAQGKRILATLVRVGWKALATPAYQEGIGFQIANSVEQPVNMDMEYASSHTEGAVMMKLMFYDLKPLTLWVRLGDTA